jgi:hypothetical protein
MSGSGDEYTGQSIVDDADGTSPTEAVQQVISAPLLAFAGGLSFLIGSAFESLADIGRIFDAAWSFMGSLLTSPEIILEITAEATGLSIAEQFGTFAWPVGVGVIMLGFFLWEQSGIGLPIVDQILGRGD